MADIKLQLSQPKEKSCNIAISIEQFDAIQPFQRLSISNCFQNKNFSDGKDKVILDTREHPLIVSDNFVQFTGVFGASEILSNGKKMASGDNLVVLYLNSDSQNPRFLVDRKEHDAFSFHWSF